MKVGDVVKLMSGGQAMTVYSLTGVGAQHSAMCVWHDEEGRPHHESYLVAVLRLA